MTAAIETSLAAGQAPRAGVLAKALQPEVTLSGQWSAWGQVIDAAFQAAQADTAPIIPRAPVPRMQSAQLGIVAWTIPLAGDDRGGRALLAWALHERGTRAALLGDRTSARADLTEARRIRLELGDQSGASASLHNLSFLGLRPPAKPRRPRWYWSRNRLFLLVVLAFVIALFGSGAAFAAGLLPWSPQAAVAPPTTSAKKPTGPSSPP